MRVRIDPLGPGESTSEPHQQSPQNTGAENTDAVNADRYPKDDTAEPKLQLRIGAALFVRTLHNLLNGRLGIDREHLLVARIDPSAAGYQQPGLLGLRERVRERLQAIPGVRSASISNGGLFSGVEGDHIAAGRLAGSLLFGVDAKDPVAASIAAGVLALAATIARVISAARVDPIVALRCE